MRPAWFFAVPRVFEKLRAAILSGADEPLREAIDRGLARVRGEESPAPDEAELAALREKLGMDALQALNVGAAPCPREVIEFFHAIGLPLGELWGMSETNAIGACNPPERIKIGTVGPPVPGVEIRLAEDDEIELRGPCVFTGYRNQPGLTRDTFTSNGWLKTGDIGAFDEDGYLSIVDRKKELIINAAGKNMSPANIESRIKAASPLIGAAVVVGDRRPYNVALIVLDPEGAASAGDGAEAAVAEAIEAANAQLASVEQVKRHTVLDAEWAPGGDELTPTMKLKRKPIAEKYAEEIEALYAR